MGKISSLRPGNSEMVVPYNEHPHKLKNGGKVKAMADGGLLEGDPTKTTTPVYDPAAFKSAVDARKGKQIPVNPQTGMIDLPPGALRAQVPLLTGDIKKKQAALDAYMKTVNLTSLTPQQSTEALSKAGLGTYNDYISQVNDYGAYRNLTVVPKQELNTTTELLPDSQRYGTTSSAPEGTGTQYSYQQTTPYDSTHAQKLFPKDTYVAPQKKADGGKVRHKDGIKGYIEGGTIDDGTTVRDTSARKYSNKPSDYLRDFAVGNADIALNGLGLENAIQDKDYKTKTGSQFNAVSRGVGTIGRGVTGAVVDYFVPGMGTGINSILNQGTQYTGEDSGINAKDKATQDKVAGSLSVVGSTVGSMLGNRQQKQAASDPNSNVDENGINTKTGEIATVTAGQKQPVTPVADGNQLTGQALNDWKSATTGEAQAAVLAKYNRGEYQGLSDGGDVKRKSPEEIEKIKTNWEKQPASVLRGWATYGGENMFGSEERSELMKIAERKEKESKQIKSAYPFKGKAEGGQIKGPGNGKSDSIPAEPEAGSFVVPAENAHIAVELRKKYLGDSGNKKADLHVKGGVKNVALSNGEHIFTKDEADTLRAKGINLDALAPNADAGSSGKADGGDVDVQAIIDALNKQDAEQKKQLAADKKARDEKYAKLQKEATDAEAAKKVADQKAEEERFAAAKERKLKEGADKIKSLYSQYQNAQNLDKEGKKKIESGESIFAYESKAPQVLKSLRGAIDVYQKEYEFYNPSEKSTTTSSSESTTKKPSALDDLNKQVAEEQKKLDESRKNRTPEQTAIAAGLKNNPSVKGAIKNTTPNGVGIAGIGKGGKKELSMAESKKLNKGIETLPVRQVPLEETTPVPPEEMAIQTPAANTSATTVATGTEKKKFNPFEKLDIGKGLAVGQTALGIEQLLQDGHRPEDSLDSDFSKAVDRAKTDANYGISSLEREIANRSIDRNRNADIQTIIGLSAGNSGVALGNIRAASISANESKNNLSAMSEQLRLQKQRYADQMVGSKADMSRKLFEDKLGAFKENQAAGAELTGAGIKNLIGGSLYDKELAAQNERQKMYNPTFTV